jgi:hypothetical protein
VSSSFCGWGENRDASNISVTFTGHEAHIAVARARLESITAMSLLQRCLWVVTTLALTSGAVGAERDAQRFEDEARYSIQIDNDFFSGAHRDEDYSWGGAGTWAAPHPGKLTRPLHSIRGALDDLLVPDELERGRWQPEQQAMQVGIIAMTPRAIGSPEPQRDDRPFANLMFVTSSEVQVLDGGERARFSSFTFGMLGLHAAEAIHRAAHRALGDEIPRGWDHQISAGGEPTARYVEAQQWLLSAPDARDADMPEVRLTVAGSAGFITEGSVALAARWGRIQSPWWSFDPELGDYTAAPIAPVARFGSASPAETFLFAGIRLKARAYNALLQGQFRHSDVRVLGDDLAHTLAEAWFGAATTWNDNRVTYAIHFATPEVRMAPGDRSLIWAGINFERSF